MPVNVKIVDIQDSIQTRPASTASIVIPQIVSAELQPIFISRNESGIIQLDQSSSKNNLAIPLTVYKFNNAAYTTVINTAFTYYVDPEKQAIAEVFYDNTYAGATIGFLVPNKTKFKTGDTVEVKQYPGAAIASYSGLTKISDIQPNEKFINGIYYDSIVTGIPFAGNTPVNGGIITWVTGSITTKTSTVTILTGSNVGVSLSGS